MKPGRIDLTGTTDVRDLMHRVLRARLAEALALAPQLEGRQPRGLHDFRIACKRLRYALERFEDVEPSFEDAALRLARVQDALGDAHDRDVLLGVLPPTMRETQRSLRAERETAVDTAAALWHGLAPTLQRKS